MAEDTGTATLDAPAAVEPNSKDTASAEDAGTGRVDVPDSPEDAAREALINLTDEQKEQRNREAYEQVKAKQSAPAREPDGKFKQTTGKPALKDAKDPGDNLEDDADTKQPKADAKPEDKADPTDTPEQREKIVIARKALRRDEWTEAEIAELPTAKLLELGARRAVAQAKTDNRFAQLTGKAGKPAEDSTPTDGEKEAEEPALPRDLELPAEALEYLTEADAGKVKGAVAQHVARATQALKNEAAQARADLFEDRCVGVQQELAASYPSLKDKTPPAEFLTKFQTLLRSGQYQTGTREGIKELMEDAATIAFGKTIKQEVQKSMIDRNRAALAGQPDPKTLQPATKRGTVTRDEYERMAYDAAKSGGSLDDQRARLHKQLAGRQVAD